MHARSVAKIPFRTVSEMVFSEVWSVFSGALVLVLELKQGLRPKQDFLLVGSLVPSQRGLCEMGYSVPHETSHFCSGTVGKRARTARSRTALEGLLCDAPMPDTSGQRPRRVSPEDSRKSWMRLANGEERHPSLQRARSRRPRPRLLAPQARPCRFRREERRVLAGDAPPLAEGVRARFESLDIGDGRRGGLRGGADGRARLGGDHPGYLVAPPFREVDAGQAVDHLPRPPLRKKKGGATG